MRARSLQVLAFIFALGSATMAHPAAEEWPLINLVGTEAFRESLSYYASFTKEIDGEVSLEKVRLKPGESAEEVVR